jgi:hypothetical protein
MDYRYIYLIFSKTGTWLSRTLSIFSESKYVHSSISFDDSFTRMYSFGRTNPDNPFSGGLVEENLYDGVYKKFLKSECVIYRVRITNKQYYSLKREIRNFLKDKDKYRYNFLGLFFILLDKPVKRKDHYFCSQFVSEVLIKSDVYATKKPPELITPQELFSIKNKELIYEGLIIEFSNPKHFGSINLSHLVDSSYTLSN